MLSGFSESTNIVISKRRVFNQPVDTFEFMVEVVLYGYVFGDIVVYPRSH